MKNVGEKIKSVRESKNVSLEETAERAGLSVEQIKTIEETNLMPSLTPLMKIARALGVRLGTFLDDQEHFGPVVCRKDGQEEAIRFSNNTSKETKNMDYFALSGSKSDRHMEPFIIEVSPAGTEQFTLSSHEGEEFIYVIDGVIEVNYGHDTYQLAAGDSIYYDSIVDHHVHATKEQPAKILAVVYTPID